MMHEPLRNSVLSRTLVDLLGNLSDLVGKEFRLARAELTEKAKSTIRASAWSGLAALLCFIAVLFLLEAAVFALVSAGIAAHWACLIVAAVLVAGAACLFAYGRSAAPQTLSPTRSIRQISEDIRTAKELVT